MEYLLFFLIGFVFALLLTLRPVKFQVHHIHEEVQPAVDKTDLKELEKEMLKDDAVEDDMYKKLDQVIVEANDIMGGSDRIDRN